MTPLSVSTLLTRNRAEPALGHELAREIASADRIDAIVAFVTVGGVRALRDALEGFARRAGAGARLRLLTTVLSGTTEVAALGGLGRLPGGRGARTHHTGRGSRRRFEALQSPPVSQGEHRHTDGRRPRGPAAAVAVAALSTILLFGVAAAAGAKAPADPWGARADWPASLPSWIVDEELHLVFLRTGGGTVVALDAAGGRELWETREIDVPLAAADGRVVGARPTSGHAAGGPRLELAVLDGRSGTVKSPVPGPLLFPLARWAPLATPRLDGDRFVLAWFARPPPSGALARHGASPTTGFAQVDLRSGKAHLGTGELEPLPPSVAARIASGRASAWRSEGWSDREGFGVLVHGPAGAGGSAVTLHRFSRDGRERGSYTLSTTLPPGVARWHVAGRAVLLQTIASPGVRTRLFSADTGEPLGDVPPDLPCEPFTVRVVGTLLVCVGERHPHAPGLSAPGTWLTAVSLETGAFLWHRFVAPPEPPRAPRPPPP